MSDDLDDIDIEALVSDDMLLDVVDNFDQDIKPLVLDMGTYTTKVGLAGMVKPVEERSLMVVSTAMVTTTEEKEVEKDNRKETVKVTKTYEEIKNHYGEDAIKQIKASFKADSKRRDTVTNVVHEDVSLRSGNLGDFLREAIFHEDHIYKRLDIEGKFIPSAHPVLLTDYIGSPLSHRSGVSELLFETFQTPAVYWELGAVLGLYASGSLDGLMVDMGHTQTSVVPVVQGYCMEHAMRRVNLGGKHFDQYFNHLLRKAGITLHTNYWLEIVRDIKEGMCQCQPDKALEKLMDDGELNCEQYRMPDGSILQIGNARKRACEIFFAPHLLGLQHLGVQHQILDCINDCDLALRKALMSNIRLMGGHTMLKGLGRRLVNELSLSDYNRYEYEKMIQNDPNDPDPLDVRHSLYNVTAAARPMSSAIKKRPKIDKKTQVRLYAPVTRKYSAWLGGSVLTSMDDFTESWITRRDFQEYGSNILYRGVNWHGDV